MKKQYDILEDLNRLSLETTARVKELTDEIDLVFKNLKKSLISAYNHDSEILYLVEFDSYRISFYKASNYILHEVHISWYESKGKKGYTYPFNYEDAVKTLSTYTNPTSCEILSYSTFGYFDDVKKRYDRIDWIAEKLHKKELLYEVTEDVFLNSIKCVSEFYGVKN